MVLLFLLWPIARAVADESRQPSDEEKEKVNAEVVETIWVEKQLTPATQWVEKLISPLTTWAERKIHNPDEVPQAATIDVDMNAEVGARLPANQPIDNEVIGSGKAAAIAKTRVEGEVLRVKLLEEDFSRYRVKMISNTGEIQLIYIDAYSGAVISNHPTQVER